MKNLMCALAAGLVAALIGVPVGQWLLRLPHFEAVVTVAMPAGSALLLGVTFARCMRPTVRNLLRALLGTALAALAAYGIAKGTFWFMSNPSWPLWYVGLAVVGTSVSMAVADRFLRRYEAATRSPA